MSDSAKVLRVLQEAAMLSRATPGRRGSIVQLDQADEVLVAGDLHGNRDNFRWVMELAALAEHPRRHLVLQEFVHGSGRYPDGSDDAHRLLELAAALKCKHPHQVHLLLGNHEHAEWTGRRVGKDGQELNQLFAQGVAYQHGARADEVMQQYRELYAAMPIGLRTPNGVFMSHSIPSVAASATFDPAVFDLPTMTPAQLERGSDLYALLWGRDCSDEASRRFCDRIGVNLVVTGHIAQEKGFGVPNPRQLIVDCVSRPAGCVLFPTKVGLSFETLLAGLYLIDRQGKVERGVD